MKIAVWHNLPSGGGKRALYGHVAGLVERGHNVEAWCPSSAEDRYLPLSTLVTEHRLPFAWPQPSHRLSNGLKERLGLNQLALVAEMNRHSEVCAQAILAGGFDLVFIASCRFFFVPRLGHFLRGRKIPTCLYLQEPARHRYEALPELPWLARQPKAGDSLFLRRWWRNFVDYRQNHRLRTDARREVEDAKAYDLILVNSYFSRESIVRIYALDAHVCYLGCDTTLFRRLAPPRVRERFVVGLGSLTFAKGVETAINAVACLPVPRPPLVWIANFDEPVYRSEMEALARQKRVDFQVRSAIEDEVLRDLLNRASLLLYTSRLEPFGFAPVEANACGLPVVAVAEGGVRETVVDGENGFLCDRDPAALAAAMERLLNDPALAAELGATGAKMAAQKWSMAPSIDRLERQLQRLLEQKTGALPTR